MNDPTGTPGAASDDSSEGAPARSCGWLRNGVGPTIGAGAGAGAGVGAIFGRPGSGAAVGAAIGVAAGAWIATRRKHSGCRPSAVRV